MTAKYLLGVSILVLAVLPAAEADLPVDAASVELNDATIEDMSTEGLSAALASARSTQGEPVWVAYEVAGVPRQGSLCCGRRDCCDVERSHDGVRIGPTDETGPIAVLLRFRDGQLSRIRTVSEGCAVGFAGRRVLWAGEIQTGTSLNLLDRWVSDSSRRIADGAVIAIAYHDDSGATNRLEALALADGDQSEEAIFWLGTARREEGLASLRRILKQGVDIERSEAVIFGLAQSPIEAAREDLAQLARNDKRSEIRSEALFWLGQTDSADAGPLIYEAALNDPDPEVAEHAVFVLSQLPERQALEYLTRLMVQRERSELRKEALFWIAQTDSDEALEIVARILNE